MNRLFVKVTTDPKRKGTLLEVRGDSLVTDILRHIVSLSPDLPRKDEDDRPIEYRLVRLGQPSTLLDLNQVFAKTGVGNGDTLLLQVGARVWKGNEFFDFSPLATPLDVSVQDLRAPLRLPVPSTAISETPLEPAVSPPPLATRPAVKSAKPPTGVFEFEPLQFNDSSSPSGLTPDHPAGAP